MTTKHTPGPWQVCPDEKEYHDAPLLVWGERGPGYGTIAEASKYQYEAAANARLIASAPDLLEVADMLDDLLLLLESRNRPEIIEKKIRQYGQAARAAIAKAKGE